MSSGKNGGFFDDSCLAVCIFGVIFMPAAGIYLLISDGSKDRKLLGLVLTIVGSILWIALGVGR